MPRGSWSTLVTLTMTMNCTLWQSVKNSYLSISASWGSTLYRIGARARPVACLQHLLLQLVLLQQVLIGQPVHSQVHPVCLVHQHSRLQVVGLTTTSSTSCRWCSRQPHSFNMLSDIWGISFPFSLVRLGSTCWNFVPFQFVMFHHVQLLLGTWCNMAIWNVTENQYVLSFLTSENVACNCTFAVVLWYNVTLDI